MRDWDKEISKLQSEIDSLQREKEKYESLTPAERLAEFLYEKFSRIYSQDSFHYEDWDRPGPCRLDWLKKAKTLLKHYEDKDIRFIVKTIRP